MDLLSLAYESCKDRTNASKEQFYSFFHSWEKEPVYVDGECVGVILMNDEEIHACILPKGFKRWITPAIYKGIFKSRLNKFGRLTTSVTRDNLIGDNFVKRLGFRVISIDSDVVKYEVLKDGC